LKGSEGGLGGFYPKKIGLEKKMKKKKKIFWIGNNFFSTKNPQTLPFPQNPPSTFKPSLNDYLYKYLDQ
jgi:hypothetical protein